MAKEYKKYKWFVKGCVVIMILVIIACSSCVIPSYEAHASTDNTAKEYTLQTEYGNGIETGPWIHKSNAIWNSSCHRYEGPKDYKIHQYVNNDGNKFIIKNVQLMFKSNSEFFDYVLVHYNADFANLKWYQKLKTFTVKFYINALDAHGHQYSQAQSDEKILSAGDKYEEIWTKNVCKDCDPAPFDNPEKWVMEKGGSFNCWVEIIP